mmetsp:Transcript_23802/g.34751  ORF Transcript_23802/g.34751 Transcript_23802/m.34751 type:complete len:260 (+) Transcript_23802:83-862(+)
MCWSVEVSLASAVLGWVTCAYLWRRNHSKRDKWYATYLVTYTFTQLVDIALWTLHESTDGGLVGCPDMKMRVATPSDIANFTSTEKSNLILSKYVVPLVTLSQFVVQLHYPSDRNWAWRKVMLAAHAIPCGLMALQFACTDIMTSNFPEPHASLRWGGYSAEVAEVLVVVAVVAADFWLTMPEISVRLAHIVVFLSVVSTLWFTEGTLAVGSKWCTYCLIFSFVYATDPIWGPGPDHDTKKHIAGAEHSSSLRNHVKAH